MSFNTNLPNLFVVGAAKAGTTSLVEYLGQHKDVFVPSNKEPRFLSYSFLKNKYQGKGDDFTKKLTIKNIDDYKESYARSKNEKILIDGSVEALYYHEDIIPKIKEINDEPYIIIMLRNPVKRAVSAYSHLIREERETLGFEEAIRQTNSRMQAGYEFIWDYLGASYYKDSVETFLNSFKKTKVIIFEDFIQNPVQTVYETLDFLGIEEKHQFVTSRHNISGSPKFRQLNRFLNGKNIVKDVLKNIIGRNNGVLLKNTIQKHNLNPITIEEEIQKNLYSKFKNDIDLLEGLLGKDLSTWRKPYVE